MNFIPGHCINHPKFLAVPGKKVCETCSNRPEPNFLSAEETAKIAAELQVKKDTTKGGENKKKGRPADPIKQSLKDAEAIAKAERKAKREEKQKKEADRIAALPVAMHNFVHISEEEFQVKINDAIKEGKTSEELDKLKKELKNNCYVCGVPKGGPFVKGHGWIKFAPPDRICPVLQSVREQGISL